MSSDRAQIILSCCYYNDHPVIASLMPGKRSVATSRNVTVKPLGKLRCENYTKRHH